MQKAYINALYEIMREDPRVVSVLSDSGTDYDEMMAREMPDQVVNVGIAEQNQVSMAAGMAMVGDIPFVYTSGAFLTYRALESLRNDVCYQRQNVKIVGMGSGTSWSTLGPSHHTTEDLAVLRGMPGLVILSASTPAMAAACVRLAYSYEGPVYIRLGMSGEAEFYEDGLVVDAGVGAETETGAEIDVGAEADAETVANEASYVAASTSSNSPISASVESATVAPSKAIVKIGGSNVVAEGNDVCIFCTGSILEEVMGAREILGTNGMVEGDLGAGGIDESGISEGGISVQVVDMYSVKPLDEDRVREAAKRFPLIVSVEEHNIHGGLGGAIAEVFADADVRVSAQAEFSARLLRIGLPDSFAKGYGTQSEVRRQNNLDRESIAAAITQALSK